MSDTKKHAILIVDDEPEILFSLQASLRKDFDVYCAESGAQALQILQEHAIHVVMTDQRMPAMTGVELICKVRTHNPAAMRIIFTGYADLKAVVDAINSCGLYRYLTKPWDPDELVRVLREAAAEYDKIVAHQQLLGEVRDYLAGRADEQATALAARLDRLGLHGDERP
jgi:DNA-binding NtrC family response regulator